MLIACPTTSINGVNLAFDIVAGTVNATDGCVTGSGCLGDGEKPPLDIGIPGLALKAGEDDAITYGIGLQLHLKAGINTDDGFVIYTHDGWQSGVAAPEFGLGARFDMPATMKASRLPRHRRDEERFGAALRRRVPVDLKSRDTTETADSTLTIADMAGGTRPRCSGSRSPRRSRPTGSSRRRSTGCSPGSRPTSCWVGSSPTRT